MSTKSLKKQLMAAIAMVLVAAVALGSSTYAWFVANNTVKAEGLQMVAKSNDTYLLISNTESTAGGIQSAAATTAQITIADPKVYPAAPVQSDTEVAYLTTSGKDVDGATITTAGAKITNNTTAAAVTNWYTAKAAAAGAATIKDGSARQLKTFEGYVIHQTLYMTVAVGSDAANNLKVTPKFTQKDSGNDLTAAKVLLVTDDGGFAILDSSKNDIAVDIKGTNTNLTSTTVRQVDLYIYVDGNASQVYTNNKNLLKGVDFTLDFTVDSVAPTT